MDKIQLAGIERIRTYTDGEGLTTLVVSMGCPLKCAYCLNPFTWDGSIKGAKAFTVDELYNELKIDDLYFLATGGGIMFGGGEPLLNSGFIADFINKYKNTGWKFNMETALSASREHLEEVCDLIDSFVVDSKDMNKERYEIYTKGDYDLFYSNLMFLKDRVSVEKITVRVPRIAGFHKNEEYLENKKMLEDLGFINIDVFDYIDPGKRKKLSDVVLNRREEFLANINN